MPYCVAIDAQSDRIFVGDMSNRRVMSYTRGVDGELNFIWQYGRTGMMGQGMPGYISAPSGCVLSADRQYLYVTDRTQDHIVKLYASDGALAGYLGRRDSDGGVEFDRPHGLATDGRYLWVGDTQNKRVACLDLDMPRPEIIYELQGDFEMLRGLAVHGKRLFVADRDNDVVNIFSIETLKEVGKIEGLTRVAGLAIDSERGILYASMEYWVRAYDLNTLSEIGRFGGFGLQGGAFEGTMDVCVDSVAREVYVVDHKRHVVSVFSGF